MALSSKRQESGQETVDSADAIESGDLSIGISLQIKGGLLMVFGPDGDPIPPKFLKEAFSERQAAMLRMADGTLVDSDRVLAVLDAQQLGRLAKRPSQAWIGSMLGLAGSFEATPQELLDCEPNTSMPPLSDQAAPHPER